MKNAADQYQEWAESMFGSGVKYYTPRHILGYMNHELNKKFDIITGNPPYKGDTMTLRTRDELFTGLLKECTDIMTSKGVDYAGNQDANRNFKHIAENLNLSKYQIWAVYFLKHVDAIINSIEKDPDTPRRQAESMTESIKDIINYAGILYSMLIEDEQDMNKSGGTM